MNNEGFAALVRKQAKISSTKEIARKAVEEEWQRNKKRRRGGSSSDEESDDGRSNKRKNKIEKEEEDDIFEPSMDYRDRAKERRDGKPSLSKQHDDETLQLNQLPSKGLDVSLARKIRKHLKSENDEGLKAEDGPAIFTSLPSLAEAKRVLQQATASDQPLSSSFVEYAQKILDQEIGNKPKKIECSLAGKHVQRSRLALTLDGCPSDVKRSWEVPREVTHTTMFHDSPRLDMLLIENIEKALPKKRSTVADIKAPKSAISGGQRAVPECDNEDSEDDDDIFGGLDDYVAPTP